MNAEVIKTYEHGFTPIGNAVLRSGMSPKAIGILCVMLSLPKDWNYSIPGLAKILGEGKDSVRTGLNELKARGFLKIEQLRGDDGKIVGTCWTISDTPMEPVAENPTMERKSAEPEADKPQLEKPKLEKIIQYKKEINIKTKKYNNSPYIPQRGNVGGEKPIQKQKRTSRKQQQQEKQEQEAQLVQVLFRMVAGENEQTMRQLNEWLEISKAKKTALPFVSIRKNLEQLPTMAKQSGLDVNSYLDQVIMRGWSGFFIVPNSNMGQTWGQRFGEGEPLKSSTYNGNLRRTKPLCFEVQA